MKDFDVIMIGGGLNGLTAAAYLQKAGLSVGVFEARGECGAHCDSIEPGIPGFLHNTHACWLMTATSPCMADLDLKQYGLELRGTDVLFAMPYTDGTSVIQALDPNTTADNIARHSEHDATVMAKIAAYNLENRREALEILRLTTFGPPTEKLLCRTAKFNDGLAQAIGVRLSGDDINRMTGFELLETIFESDKVRSVPVAVGEGTGLWPLNRRIAPQMMVLAGLGSMAVHTAKGGSHALTHSLVKCFLAHGGTIWTSCPVEKILVENGKATGIRLCQHALLSAAEIRAKTIISGLSCAPTFLQLLDEDSIGGHWTQKVKSFTYDDPVVFVINFALKGDPVFASAQFEPAIQRAWTGYIGGESLDAIRTNHAEIASGILPDDIMGGWFIPTRADPSQAPAGCHTCYGWVSVPARLRRWRGKKLNGWDTWRSKEFVESLADAFTERLERYAPGFKDLTIERHVNTPLDQEYNNPSAIYGNMLGGSIAPEQFGANRPLPGMIKGGVSRSFFPNLYLCNSIHPFGATNLASGYLTATEVAQDLGCRQQEWWQSKPFDWLLQNYKRIPLNLGVDPNLAGGGAA